MQKEGGTAILISASKLDRYAIQGEALLEEYRAEQAVSRAASQSCEKAPRPAASGPQQGIPEGSGTSGSCVVHAMGCIEHHCHPPPA